MRPVAGARREAKRLHAIVHGFVQRVGFRQFALRRARALGLTGWVMNREDGAVEIVAEGVAEDLERFLRKVCDGPTYARVQEVEVEWGDPQRDSTGFQIRFAD